MMKSRQGSGSSASPTERVVELPGLPSMDPGDTAPAVFEDDGGLVLAYRIGELGRVRALDAGLQLPDDAAAVVQFHWPGGAYFGPPNDEALNGHRLYGCGLMPYLIGEVIDSEWIEALRRENSVHPQHRDAAFIGKRHFVFAFHDSFFECMAEGFDVLLVPGPPRSALLRHVSSPRDRGPA